MITKEQQMQQGAELIKTLAQKAWESSTFKEQLVKNPVSTIESVTGQKVTSEARVVVEDQTDESIIYLNIPRRFEFDELELTDEQLETVSGGSTPACVVYAGYLLGCATCIGIGVLIGHEVGKM